jgi:hypothetical protein
VSSDKGNSFVGGLREIDHFKVGSTGISTTGH